MLRKWFTSSAMQHIKLGKYNQLEVVKTVDFGVYLDGFDDGEILLPTRYVPADCRVGDVLNVFIYLDNEERLVATTLEPLVQVGQFCLAGGFVGQRVWRFPQLGADEGPLCPLP